MNAALELVAVFALRAIQAAVLCLPTLLSGMVVAGVLRAIVGRQNVNRWIGRGAASDLLRAWVAAFFLPVCSFGVLPIIVTLRAMGTRWGPLVVIAIAGPWITPWTLGYLIDRTGPAAFLLLLTSNAMIALAAGGIVDRLDSSATPVEGDAPDVLPTHSTLLNTLWSTAVALNRHALVLIGIGLFGVGAIAVCIPPNAVGDWLVERSVFHAGILTAIPLFTYVTPEVAAMQAGEVVRSSLMPGLIVPLIGLGATIHLGMLAGFGRAVGVRRLLPVLGVVVVVVAVWGVVTDLALYDGSYSPEDSHAFEDYGRPFHLLDHPDGRATGFFGRLRRPLGMNALTAGAAIALILAARVLIGRLNNVVPEVELAFVSPSRARLAMRIIVLMTVVLAIYTYYPPPSALKRELQAASAELSIACQTGEQVHVRRLAQQMDRRLAQFTKSAMLHGRFPTAEQRAAINDVRQYLTELMTAMDNSKDNRNAGVSFHLKIREFLRTMH